MQRIQNQQGFSLIEVLVASAIILLISLLTMSLFVGGYRQTATSSRMTNAVNLARSQLEQIRSTPFQEIPSAYPTNQQNPGVLASLPEGRWSVSYPSGTAIDPLAVRVKVQWTENEVPHEVVLDTLIANADL